MVQETGHKKKMDKELPPSYVLYFALLIVFCCNVYQISTLSLTNT